MHTHGSQEAFLFVLRYLVSLFCSLDSGLPDVKWRVALTLSRPCLAANSVSNLLSEIVGLQNACSSYAAKLKFNRPISLTEFLQNCFSEGRQIRARPRQCSLCVGITSRGRKNGEQQNKQTRKHQIPLPPKNPNKQIKTWRQCRKF